MSIRITMATATALGLLMGGAYANDDNSAYVSQDGQANAIRIQQNAGTGGNDIGLDGAPILQKGNNNSFSETQATGGGFSRGNNDITAGEQRGNNNSFSSDLSNNAGDNTIGSFLQHGNGNIASVTRNNQRNGTVQTIIQGAETGALSGGNGNRLSITQSTHYLPSSQPPFGGGNTIEMVKQIGSNNGDGGNRYDYGTWIVQGGSLNTIQEATIEGSNNNAAHPSAVSPSIPNPEGYASLDIRQRGIGNGSILSIARMVGSNGNQLVVDQFGDHNQFDLQQGVDTTSTGNNTRAFQTGDLNEVTGRQQGSYNTIVSTQDGVGNVLTVIQNGDGNSAAASFLGNGNGDGPFQGGVTATLDGLHSQLTQGTIFQDSSAAASGNTVTYDVTGSNNLFAFAQLGGGNTINGTVGGTGASNGNEAAVIQNGGSNLTSFAQNGGGFNLVAVSQ